MKRAFACLTAAAGIAAVLWALAQGEDEPVDHAFENQPAPAPVRPGYTAPDLEPIPAGSLTATWRSWENCKENCID